MRKHPCHINSVRCRRRQSSAAPCLCCPRGLRATAHEIDATMGKIGVSMRRTPQRLTGGGALPAVLSSVMMLLQALDAIIGEGGDAVLADAIDAQAAVLGEHVD